MAKLIYSVIASLDGYVENQQGDFDWAMPDEAVHRFINDLERPVGTYLYGRRMYETMTYWETAHAIPDEPDVVREFTDIWLQAEKVVYSRSLEAVSTARTRIERTFDPDSIRALKASAERDITVGGADLAGQALARGLVDELQAFTVPALVGGGRRSLPERIRFDLDLLETVPFDNGFVFSRYKLRP